jgi:hypothetical protein
MATTKVLYGVMDESIRKIEEARRRTAALAGEMEEVLRGLAEHYPDDIAERIRDGAEAAAELSVTLRGESPALREIKAILKKG